MRKFIVLISAVILSFRMDAQFIFVNADTVYEGIKSNGYYDYRIETNQKVIVMPNDYMPIMLASVGYDFSNSLLSMTRPYYHVTKKGLFLSSKLFTDTLLPELRTPNRYWSWAIDSLYANFIESKSLGFRNLNTTILKRMAQYGKYYNFRLFVLIPANQLSVTVPDGTPGKLITVTTWGDWANHRPTILKRKSNGNILVPLQSGTGTWFDSGQITRILAANANLTFYTDINFENQMVNNYLLVSTISTDVSARTDYYTYNQFQP
jgi:hypothetical protein